MGMEAGRVCSACDDIGHVLKENTIFQDHA